MMSAVDRAKNWFQQRFDLRHTVHIVPTGLKPGYVETDVVILNVTMNLVKRFVENELESPPQGELAEIYHWWTVERLEDQAHLESLYSELPDLIFEPTDRDGNIVPKDVATLFRAVIESDDVLDGKIQALEDKIKADEEKYLIMVAKIRPTLWT